MYHSLCMLIVREKCIESRKEQKVRFLLILSKSAFSQKPDKREQGFVWLLLLSEVGEFDVINSLSASTSWKKLKPNEKKYL